jgi:hypothetical protein
VLTAAVAGNDFISTLAGLGLIRRDGRREREVSKGERERDMILTKPNWMD